MKYFYLLINVCAVIVPLIFSFHKKINFYKKYGAAIPALLFTAILFIAWDIVFTAQGIWGFNHDYITGIYWFNLPMEEVLFFVCIPYACMFTYYSLGLFYNFSWGEHKVRIFCIITALLLLIIAGLCVDKAYTFTAFSSTAMLLLLFKFVFKVKWLSRLFSIYPVLLIPFFIVNGMLTGAVTADPVVWYNDSQNIGLRIYTIPVEDVVYGFELIMVNIFFFESLGNFVKMVPVNRVA
jgi:lycopene cyclase domain-containing protein